VQAIHIVYASTSGHTEYVCGVLADALKAKGHAAEVQRAELVKGEDLLKGDVLVLASSTWNTGNVEGQLNPHMWTLLLDRAKDVQLAGKKVACVALGDERYFYTANAAKHLEEFVASHGGNLIEPTLKIVNEPFGQEKKVQEWAESLSAAVS
jgi:flavodoxin I